MRELKKKKLVKVKTTKQIIFEKHSDSTFKKIENHRYSDAFKSRDAVLISAKKIDQFESNCFICHKSSYIFKKCFNRIIKINVLNDDAHKYDRFSFNSNFDLKN